MSRSYFRPQKTWSRDHSTWTFNPSFLKIVMSCDVSNTRDSVSSSGCPNTENRVENTKCGGLFLTKHGLECLIYLDISLKLYLNSLVYRKIFGSPSKVFSNLRKFSENVRERSSGLRNNFEKSEILFLLLEIKFKSSRHRIISYVSCTSTSRYSVLHNNKAIFDYSDFFQTITIHNPEDRDYQIIDCCQSIAFDKEFCSIFLGYERILSLKFCVRYRVPYCCEIARNIV